MKRLKLKMPVSYMTVIWTAFAAAVFFNAVVWAFPLVTTQEPVMPDAGERNIPDELPAGPDEVRTYEYYAGELGRHRLFGVLLVARENKEPSPTAAEILSTLRLLGVIGGKKSQAIIEDMKQRQTYYLREGERIKDMVIKKIRKGRVFLEFEGSILELHL
ncbi:MAG: hypothetical protein MJA29_11675 [Candidatus Omnitrophica bacterium]|nr:hypothetical protein [Candidatus Omnitrophota bacterium]